ncbi:hypothetical protein GCM10012287_35690 [Streptomyces daqingensis]|uniref:Uncharacterized protein n=1 Tax=Streptomyces daqingensis TaxID=1472640 RepID=A0ABQ2MGK2_9ACTN|nr:hypothetical protein [Streptomyces daqingensis]GGO52113.1 hypothetical protein GCM10012287_35690 [Streptomyces daqingensis]
MTSHDILTRQLCMATDVEKYSRLDTLQQEVVQADLLRVLEEAALLSGLDRASWERQAQGDQEFAVLPPDTPESVVLSDFIRHLDAALNERNAFRPEKERMRLRLAIEIGVARTAPLGHSGPAPVFVARFLNAPQLKSVLKATSSTNLAVILSDRVYQDVVRLRGQGLDPEQYMKVHIQQDDFTGYAWIHLPGHSPAEIRGLTEEVDSCTSTATTLEGDSRMLTPTEIAAMAGTAVVGAMATDTWGYVRARCKALFSRHEPEKRKDLLEELDAFQQALTATSPAQRKALTTTFAERATAELTSIASKSAEASKAVRALADEASSPPPQKTPHNNLTNIRAGGDFIMSGRDSYVTKEEGK